MRNYWTIFKVRTQVFAGPTCLFMAATLYSTSNPERERERARASECVRTREQESQRETDQQQRGGKEGGGGKREELTIQNSLKVVKYHALSGNTASGHSWPSMWQRVLYNH
jgi:hypothetical protein